MAPPRLAGYEELVAAQRRELVEEDADCIDEVGAGLLIARSQVGVVTDGGEANARGLLNEDHVGALGPGEVVDVDVAVLVGPEGTLLTEEAQQPRASRPSVRPGNHGRACRVDVSGRDEPEENGLVALASGHVQVPRILLEVGAGGEPWQRRDAVGVRPERRSACRCGVGHGDV